MGLDTGFGSPVGPATGEGGFGSPVSPTYALEGETGFGSPVFYTEDEPQLPMVVRGAFQTAADYARYGWDPAYSQDGGALVEVEAVWPSSGPMTAWLRDADGTLYPDANGCRSGVPGQGAALYPNESLRFLRFAFPRVPLGTYDLVVEWDSGGATLTGAVRAVPRSVPAFTRSVLKYAGVGLWMEKQ